MVTGGEGYIHVRDVQVVIVPLQVMLNGPLVTLGGRLAYGRPWAASLLLDGIRDQEVVVPVLQLMNECAIWLFKCYV